MAKPRGRPRKVPLAEPPAGPLPRMPAEVKREIAEKYGRGAIDGKIQVPHLSEVALYFFAEAGGPAEVAKLLYEEFKASEKGSLARQRIMQLIIGVTKFSNEVSALSPEDMSLLTDADLKHTLAETLASVSQKEVQDAAE